MIHTIQEKFSFGTRVGAKNQKEGIVEVLTHELSTSSNSTDSSEIMNLSTYEMMELQMTKNINNETMQKQSEYLVEDFNEALCCNSEMTMLPNYDIQPTGEECGNYLVVDVGGSTLRIAVVQIDPPAPNLSRQDRVKVVIVDSWIIDNNFKILNRDFFSWIGEKVTEIIGKQDVINRDDTVIKAGFTWSFPLNDFSHNSGKIVHVSKGYSIDDNVYNADLKTLFETIAKKDHNLNIDIKSVVNDSLAVYTAGCFVDNDVKLAIVLGTGLNMCFPIETSKIHFEKSLDRDRVLLNVELSMFGHRLPNDFSTKYDVIVDDRFSLMDDIHFKPFMTTDPIKNELFQPSELMTSGRYLPELTRLVLVDMIAREEIFKSNNEDISLIQVAYEGFSGKLMCFIDENDDEEAIIEEVCNEYHWKTSSITKEDVSTLKALVNCIIRRAAFILAVNVVSFIKLCRLHNENQDFEKLTIGYVGSVLNHFKKLRNCIRQYVNEYAKEMGIDTRIDFRHIEDSSIVGAAVAAAHYS